MNELWSHIESCLDVSVTRAVPLSGGDIASVLRLETDHTNFVLKYSSAESAQEMFKSEALGLQTISETQTIKTPKVIARGVHKHWSYLVMDYIQSKSPDSKDMALLGKQVALLHRHTSQNFGFIEHNFIGSLRQPNAIHSNWVDFYTSNRLSYQLNLAIQKGLLHRSEVPGLQDIKGKLKLVFKEVSPSLLHGDLWSGNFLISKDGEPYLIDPAVYYGHSEVDIAMSQLFGGFHQDFYEAYHDLLPKSINYEACINLYQLYYLLVHLNLFGRSYYGSVKRLLGAYF